MIDAECPPPSLTTISMTSITNRMTPWSSPSNSRTTSLKRCLSTKAIPQTSFTGQLIKNYNFHLLPWLFMTNPSMGTLKKRSQPVDTSPSHYFLGRSSNQNHTHLFACRRCTHAIQRPPRPPIAQHFRHCRLNTTPSHRIPLPIRLHHYHPWRPTPRTRMLYSKPAPSTTNPTNQPHRTTTRLLHNTISWRPGSQSRTQHTNRANWRNCKSRTPQRSHSQIG